MSLMMLHDQVDPIVEMLDRLGRVTTTEELEDVLHPKDLFTGYGGREEIFATIQRRLAEIVDSKLPPLDSWFAGAAAWRRPENAIAEPASETNKARARRKRSRR